MTAAASNARGDENRRRLLPSILLVGVLVVSAVIVGPAGNFPLDDDWDFAFSTWTLAHTGRFQATPFTASSVKLQLVWGALWAIFFGESFTVLRLSTLFLSAWSLFLFDGLLARLGLPMPVRLLAGFSLLVHPLFYWASFTYMTHVPFVFVSIVAMRLFFAGLAEDRLALMWGGAAAALASSFVRQMGVVNAIPAIIVLVLMRGSISDRWRRLLVPPAVCLAAYLVLLLGTSVFISSPTEFQAHHKLLEPSIGSVVWNFVLVPVRHLFFNFQSGALFALPMLVALSVRGGSLRRGGRRMFAGACAVFFAVAAWTIFRGNTLPYMNGGNVFSNLGLGPHTLRDVFQFGYPYPHHLGSVSRAILSLGTAALGAWALALSAVALTRSPMSLSRESEIAARYAAAHAVAGSLILCFMRIWFDRYTLDSLWPLILLAALLLGSPGRAAIRWGAAAAVLVGLFALSSTQEYLSWNRARWRAVAAARSAGIGPERMDGGYEVNAILALKHGRARLGKPGFGVIDDEFILAFNPVRGYQVLRAFPYTRLLGLSQGIVYLERRAPEMLSSPRSQGPPPSR